MIVTPQTDASEPARPRFGLSVSSSYADLHAKDFQEAKEVGFEDCLASDRMTGDWASPDPIAFLASAAPIARGLDLLAVCIAPYRQPLQLARSFATLASLASGRTILVAALGGDYSTELQGLALTKQELPGRLEEGIDLCRRLWAGQDVIFHGRYHKVEGIRLPALARTPAVWLAHRARSDASIERTARIADGWLASWVSPQRLRTAGERIVLRAEQYGRDSRQFEIGCLIRIRLAETVEQAVAAMAEIRTRRYGHPYQPDLVRHLQVGGPPEVCTERLSEFISAGANRIILQLECDREDRDDQLSWLLDEVLVRRGGSGLALRT